MNRYDVESCHHVYKADNFKYNNYEKWVGEDDNTARDTIKDQTIETT